MTLDDWRWVLDINLTGTFTACKAVVPKMRKAGGGRIVAISSVGGRTGRPRVGVNYAASKAGVDGLVMCLARELGTFNITVNSIAPGPLAGRMTASMPPDDVKRLIGTACIERLGRPDDIASAAVYLASDEAGWVTGEVLDVNGGVYI
jgi:NAD(P)-dependent dehydrogenase (short-subunit alcohol dehydrogenase family)